MTFLANKSNWIKSLSLAMLAAASVQVQAYGTGTMATDMAMGATSLMWHKVGSKQILTDAHSMTLYTFDKDSKGQSNCYGGCATNWPPLMVKDGAKAEGDFSIISRKDGSKQWAYKGWPLYFWINDHKPGDMTGDGVGGAWHVIEG